MPVVISMSIIVLLSISLPSLYQRTCGTGRPVILQLRLTLSPALRVSTWSGDHSISGATGDADKKNYESASSKMWLIKKQSTICILLTCFYIKNTYCSHPWSLCIQRSWMVGWLCQQHSWQSLWTQFFLQVRDQLQWTGSHWYQWSCTVAICLCLDASPHYRLQFCFHHPSWECPIGGWLSLWLHQCRLGYQVDLIEGRKQLIHNNLDVKSN